MKPCKTCPFLRSVKPGALGGGKGPDTFIGQAYGPFWLPCHSSKGYDVNDRKTQVNPANEQCRGAAIFRANVEVAPLLPKGLLALPTDKELVFGTPAEFLSHHAKISEATATLFLQLSPPAFLAWVELKSPRIETIPITKP